jgi:hypothetical protein
MWLVGTITSINPTNIRVGSNQPFGEYLNGAVDEVRYYNRLLSQAEVQTDMNTRSADNTAPAVKLQLLQSIQRCQEQLP